LIVFLVPDFPGKPLAGFFEELLLFVAEALKSLFVNFIEDGIDVIGDEGLLFFRLSSSR